MRNELQNKYMKENWMGWEEGNKSGWMKLMRSSKREKWEAERKKLEIYKVLYGSG